MNLDRLTETLLEDEPQNWPAPWRDLAGPAPVVPERIRHRIDAALADLSTDRRAPANRAWVYAAAAVVLVVAGVALSRLGDTAKEPGPLLVERAESVNLIRDSKVQPLADGEIVLRAGDVLRLPPGADLELTDAGRAGFRFSHDGVSPDDAELRLEESTDRLVLQPHGGALFVTTRKSEAERRPIILQTGRMHYELLGTTVRLRFARLAAILEVLEGPVEARDARSGASVILEDRTELTVSPDDPALPEPGRLSAAAVAELAGLDQAVADSRGWHSVVIQEDATETAEAAPGPRFVRLTLEDGRSYEGYLTDQGDTVLLRTEHSTITVARNKVKKIEALPDQPE